MRRWALAAAIVLVCALVVGSSGFQTQANRRANVERNCTAAIGLVLLDDEAGLYVLGVTDGSLAGSAGIRPGDVLTMALETPLSTTSQLEDLIVQYAGEALLPITVARQEQIMTVNLSLQ